VKEAEIVKYVSKFVLFLLTLHAEFGLIGRTFNPYGNATTTVKLFLHYIFTVTFVLRKYLTEEISSQPILRNY
jgi:hypothetical protein